MRQRHLDNSRGIFLMWFNWALSTGLLILVVVVSLWIKPIYLPLLALSFDFLLFLMIRRNRESRVPACYLIPFICSRVLFWSALTMALLNVLFKYKYMESHLNITDLNYEIPYITQLIIAPMTLIITLWAEIKKKKLSFCRDCKMRYGTPAERGFLGKIFSQEGRYQCRLLLYVSLISTIIAWAYYFIDYENVSLTSTDKFFYVWIAVAVYTVTVVFMAFRYMGLWTYYCKKEENLKMHAATMTTLRYVLFNDNSMCLRTKAASDEREFGADAEFKPDTPAYVNLSYRSKVSVDDARMYFANLYSLGNVDLRFMYANLSTNADRNIFHYLVFLTDEQKLKFDAENSGCEWVGLTEIANLINSGKMAPLMSAEFIRLHTILMAWKTYDEEGRRKYKIKHYKPTFRLCDIPKFDVDYNDMKWLYVADNNEDVRFYKLRKFWRKHINGIG